jgi:hypothetical protein
MCFKGFCDRVLKDVDFNHITAMGSNPMDCFICESHPAGSRQVKGSTTTCAGSKTLNIFFPLIKLESYHITFTVSVTFL